MHVDHGLDIEAILRTTSSQHGFYQNIWITLHLWRAFGLGTSRFVSGFPMALERSGTAHTLLSRQWTTSEMFEGLSQILIDGKDELPDDLEQLEVRCSSWVPVGIFGAMACIHQHRSIYLLRPGKPCWSWKIPNQNHSKYTLC